MSLLSDAAGPECFWQSNESAPWNHELTVTFTGDVASANRIAVCDQNNSNNFSPDTVGVRVTLAADGREVTLRVVLTSQATRAFTTLYDGAAFTKCVVSMDRKDRTRNGSNVKLHGLRVWRRGESRFAVTVGMYASYSIWSTDMSWVVQW